MARTVQITNRGRTAKVRNPWATFLFALITLGFYYLVWYYKINREMSDWGEHNNIDIGLSPRDERSGGYARRSTHESAVRVALGHW